MISKKLIVASILLLQLNCAKASQRLPIDTFGSRDLSKPLVLYITGDGGFNDFSEAFIKQWNTNGYPIVALSAKAYFRETKTPEAAARDVAGLIAQYLVLWKRREVILIGFSFGADVMPFIQTRLGPAILNKVRRTLLFSPSTHTDFTTHFFYDNSGYSVAAEINKLNKPVLIVFGEKETDLPNAQVNNKHVTMMKVTGSHHYANKIADIINEISGKL